MPPPAHIQVTYSGILGPAATPVEEFSMGVALGLGTGATETSPFTVLSDMQALADSLKTSCGALATLMNSSARFTECKVAFVKSDGKVAMDPSGAYLQGVSTVNTPGQGTGNLPPQVALTCSLKTAAAGPTGKGRFYLPQPTFPVGTDFRLSVTDQTAAVTGVKSFLDDINTKSVALTFGRVVVASGGSALRGIAPALREVTHARVGRVLDTQRRRRGELLEEHAESALA